MKQARQVRNELLLGLAIWVALTGIILTCISPHHAAAAAGAVFGGAAAAMLILHMYKHLDIALDLEENGAKRHIQVSYFKRMLLMGAVIAVSLVFSQYLLPLSVILSLFGIKVSALGNPLLHKLFFTIGNCVPIVKKNAPQ